MEVMMAEPKGAGIKDVSGDAKNQKAPTPAE